MTGTQRPQGTFAKSSSREASASRRPGVRHSSWLENLPDVAALLEAAPVVRWPRSREELLALSFGTEGGDRFEVAYDVPNKGRVVEAEVIRCKNGIAVNYSESYMRRRDPHTMLIADDGPTDKEKFDGRFGYPFAGLRRQIFDWLAGQELIALPFSAGSGRIGHDCLFIGPANAGFFAAALADLQGMLDVETLDVGFRPRAVLFLAPPFRHTHCGGKQVVVHNRGPGVHEVFALNLYPGPSAKKGVYGILLDLGESQGWVTAHASVVRVVTPYDNTLTIMHEGASGGGKSEMLEYPHRELDGRIVLGKNTVTGEKRLVPLTQGCALEPVTDDMALCHPSLQNQGDVRKLTVTDAENAWFVRVDHIETYGSNPDLEGICVVPAEPLLFLNIEAVPKATCLIWEHIEDEPGKRCPNPRVILPRRLIPRIVTEPVDIDIRSFGVRTPPCTRENPSYGIIGILHLLPPALAWLWRLASPRGHANPSIIGGSGLTSEGVGSFWPFATGRRVEYANLLLEQFRRAQGTRYVLMPNQHIGAWKVGFNGQWIAREYLARRGGAKFRPDQVMPARCPLLGYAMRTLQVEGAQIASWFLRTETQPEIGNEGYDAGAAQLAEFFRNEAAGYLKESGLDSEGAAIIRACLDGAGVETYEALLK
ncbi:MAG: DUF4914 family protein, partial [Alphaproteobacteria bacterium]|nr:DUF4914 family protein [Alphaproteobacteria bacterium]